LPIQRDEPEEALAANKSIIEEMIKTYADTGLSKDATVVSNLYKTVQGGQDYRRGSGYHEEDGS